jgi:homoserine kinase type II
LFDGDRVSGVVDFGALRIECVAADLARLLGSLVGDDAQRWRLGLAAYEEVRPLHDNERRLVAAFDAANVVLSGMNWLRWICLEQRQFESRQRVLSRLDEILLRLERPTAPAVE